MTVFPKVRDAHPGDLAQILALRNFYIAHSYATFDEDPIDVEMMTDWMARFRRDGPYRLLVATDGARILGYCCSQPYRDLHAFHRTVETSIYTQQASGRQGVGSALYSTLFDALAGQTLHRAVVGIALPNDASVALHAKFGFLKVGVFDEYATKNGQYLSSQWMQRPL